MGGREKPLKPSAIEVVLYDLGARGRLVRAGWEIKRLLRSLGPRRPESETACGACFGRECALHFVVNPTIGQGVPLFPQGQGRVRAYLIHEKHTSRRFQGEGDLPHFIAESIRTGAPAEFYANARAAGPLATFDGADTWVAHPYKESVALIGDAAAANDPSFGEGLSLVVRDVRVLRDQLLSHEDWDVAGHAYAEEHDGYYGALHTATGWFGQIFYESGPEAEARRAKAMPLIAQDGTRVPDHIFSGPELPLDETVRRRFFGEE
jgi:2-polyprenyl-6-methoxyphenol hydroxylase-like FAD-dependent oxidoreductase